MSFLFCFERSLLLLLAFLFSSLDLDLDRDLLLLGVRDLFRLLDGDGVRYRLLPGERDFLRGERDLRFFLGVLERDLLFLRFGGVLDRDLVLKRLLRLGVRERDHFFRFGVRDLECFLRLGEWDLDRGDLLHDLDLALDFFVSMPLSFVFCLAGEGEPDGDLL